MNPGADQHAGYAPYADGEQPPFFAERYRSTHARAPSRPFFAPPRTVSELTGPVFSAADVMPGENHLAFVGGEQALGQLMILEGIVTDEAGRPVPSTLVEIWQTNAAGKYNHPSDGFRAPLDPGFAGCGRCVTDAEGRYRFITVKPGAYPVQGSGNWWRPPHIHFSLFGPTYLSRLVSQLYFPGEPLNDLDPILAAVADPTAQARLIARYEPDAGVSERALGYRFNITLRGRAATPMVG